MFTGLIEEQGKIKECKTTSKGMEISVACKKILEDICIGDSISINGACQTVIAYGSDYFTVQASNETLKVTDFSSLKAGDFVNLERAVTLNKKLAGHIVSGHIDCTAEIIDSREDGFCKRFYFKLPQEFTKYVINKGSIAINGVSLTVAEINNDVFCVELIPATLKEVNLSLLKKGDKVNIETDLFAKYVEKILNSNNNTSKIDYDFLAQNGFV